MKKILYISIFVSLAFSSFSCGNHQEKEVRKGTPISVKVASVEGKNNSSWISASGKIEAANSASLSTRMMGFVEKIHVNVGASVLKGQLLVSLNNADLSAKRAQAQAAIIEANAAFTNAEKDYHRFQNLFAAQSATRKEMDDMTARYEMSKARLEAAKQMKNEVDAQFAYSNIRAPFDGVVTQKFIDEGAMANPGMPLISVEGPTSFEAKVSIAENEISNVHASDTVRVRIKSTGTTLKGVVKELSTSARNTGGQYLATITLTNADENIRSGMYATVEFPSSKIGSGNNMITIPQSALVTQGQLTGLYTVSESNTALLRWIRIGATYGDKVEVLSGLTSDERYIVSAEAKLYNGAPIEVQ